MFLVLEIVPLRQLTRVALLASPLCLVLPPSHRQALGSDHSTPNVKSAVVSFRAPLRSILTPDMVLISSMRLYKRLTTQWELSVVVDETVDGQAEEGGERVY